MAQERIGRYRILEEIAAGTRGAVFRAFDPQAGHLVAVKILHASLTGDSTYVERFQREATLAASIDHPNVVQIYEVGEDSGRHFMALEFLPENLARLIESGGLPHRCAASLGAQIADGLAAAHAREIIHRDIKPQNVLITPDGTPKVTDFGIARAESMSTMTATGMMMGTPYYMSPEQARGERADSRSDVYSLGCVLYQMLTGEVPFQASTPLAVLRQHTDERPRPVRRLRSDVPRELAAVVERSMEKDAGKRYANAAEMAMALRAAVPGLEAAAPAVVGAVPRGVVAPPAPPPPPSGQPSRPRRRRFAYWFGATCLVMAVALFVISQKPRETSAPQKQPTTPSVPATGRTATPTPSDPTTFPVAYAATAGPGAFVKPESAPSYELQASVVASFKGPAWTQPEDRDAKMNFVLRGKGPGVPDAVEVSLPDGTALWLAPHSDESSHEADWVTSFRFGGDMPEAPKAGGKYVFTCLDASGVPLPGASVDVTWQGTHPPDPSTNVIAKPTRDGILVTWDEGPRVPGSFDPENGLGWYHLDVIAPGVPGQVYEVGRIRGTAHLIPLHGDRFRPDAEGIPVNDWGDGEYRLSVAANGVDSEGRAASFTSSIDPEEELVLRVEHGVVVSVRKGGMWLVRPEATPFPTPLPTPVPQLTTATLVPPTTSTVSPLPSPISVPTTTSTPTPTQPPEWVHRDSFTFDPLTAIDVAPGGDIYVASGSRVYRSVDAGETWDGQWSEADCWIRNVEFATRSQGVAVSDCGRMVKTVDGGLTWRRVSDDPLDGWQPKDVHFIDPLTGWIAGDTGSLAVTHDGGWTWDRIYVPTRSELRAVYFADENRGWLAGLDRALLSTSDGGATWERVSTPNECQVQVIEARPPVIWAASGCGDVIFSADDGQTWDNRSPQEGVEIVSVAFLDERTAWISGRLHDTDSPVVLGTSDGGKTWRRAFQEPALVGYVSEMVVRETEAGLVGWAVGDGGLLLELVPPDEVPVMFATPTPVPAAIAPAPPRGLLLTMPAWERQPEFTFDSLHSVETVGADRVYAGGDGGAVYRSLDGGNSWDLSPMENSCWVPDLQFVSEDVGLTIDSCDGGNLLRTEDGGMTWRRSAASAFHEQGARAVHFLDADNGWGAGDNGAFARTTDGGNTWERLDVPTSWSFEAVRFADENHGWVVGLQGTILRTRDGGATWERAATGRLDCGRVVDIEVRFPLIWAVDNCSGIYSSRDGGESWKRHKVNFNGGLRTVAFWDERTAWVGGAVGDGHEWPVILETRDGGQTWQEAFRAEDIEGQIEDIEIEETADGAVGWAVGQGGMVVRMTAVPGF